MQKNSIGLIELTSIAAGFQVADAMLKAAEVEIILSRTICSGKYMVLIGGDVAAVTSSVEAGGMAGRGSIIDAFVIPNVHPEVFPAIAGATKVDVLEALGIVESFSVASLIEAADAAMKAARVQL
ncbi:MAG TPA: BMC domain-containing protein, partial [Bacteroidota bacterium]|nr:BMC domain-containing protein [Bacteroidota bacterium]